VAYEDAWPEVGRKGLLLVRRKRGHPYSDGKKRGGGDGGKKHAHQPTNCSPEGPVTKGKGGESCPCLEFLTGKAGFGITRAREWRGKKGENASARMS